MQYGYVCPVGDLQLGLLQWSHSFFLANPALVAAYADGPDDLGICCFAASLVEM
jgi:hypothetical protein